MRRAHPSIHALLIGAALGLGLAATPVPGRAAPPPSSTRARTGTADLAIVGAEIHVGDGSVIPRGRIIIRDGRIVEVTAETDTSAPPLATRIIDAQGAIVTPGIIAADSTLGVVEIELERSARDHSRNDGHHVRAAYDPADGIFADSTLIPIQAMDGVTTAAVAPVGGLLGGQVAWIDLVAGDYEEIVAARGVAIDGSMGQIFGGSRAATLAELRRVLDDARLYLRARAQHERRQLRDLAAHPHDLAALGPVLSGKIPLTITAHRAGDILALVELAERYRIELVIVGGAEAWKVAPRLAQAGVPVVLRPSDNLPRDLEQLGARLENAALLHAAGVSVVIAIPGDAHNLRNIKQEAGIAVANGLPPEVALGAITLEVARAYKMDRDYGSLTVGKVANVVVWPADPFELSSYPSEVIVRGQSVPLRSRQTELRDRYLRRHGLGAGSVEPAPATGRARR